MKNFASTKRLIDETIQVYGFFDLRIFIDENSAPEIDFAVKYLNENNLTYEVY